MAAYELKMMVIQKVLGPGSCCVVGLCSTGFNVLGCGICRELKKKIIIIM